MNVQLDRDVVYLLISEKTGVRDTYNDVIRRMFKEIKEKRKTTINGED